MLIGASGVRQLEQNVAALDRLAVDSGINLWAASSQA